MVGKTAAHLPDEVLAMVLAKLAEEGDAEALARAGASCRRWLRCADAEAWRACMLRQFGMARRATERAAALAGGYRELFAARFGAVLAANAKVGRAVKTDKFGMCKTSTVLVPSQFELEAMWRDIMDNDADNDAALGPAAPSQPDCDVSSAATLANAGVHRLVFLIDGSSSVTADDFAAMTGFVIDTLRYRACLLAEEKCAHTETTVLQFSDAVRVLAPLARLAPAPPGAAPPPEPHDSVTPPGSPRGVRVTVGNDHVVLPEDDDVTSRRQPEENVEPEDANARMYAHVRKARRHHGGTDIAMALRAAQDVLAAAAARDGTAAASTVVLLSDGRLDTSLAHAAAEAAAELGAGAHGARLYALGVGRAVDRVEMARLLRRNAPLSAADPLERYLDLRAL